MITHNSDLTRRELVALTLAGAATPRPPAGPLAVHYCARLAEVSLREYTLNSRVMAECILHYYERFQPDAIWLSADTWVNAEAAGAPVAFPGEDQPLAGTGCPLIQSAADIDRLPVPDLGRGRWPVMLDAMTRLKRAVGERVFIVACFDQYPFSLACALMGLENLMLKVADDRPMVEALLERCRQFTLTYARALAAAGANLLSGGDSAAGLLGPAGYCSLALPGESAVIQTLKSECHVPVSLHICGKATSILPDMARAGADVLELDQLVDMATAVRVVPPHLTLWGNLDPVGLLAQSTPDAVREKTRALVRAVSEAGRRRFVLSSGCTLAMETPSENLEALCEAAREGWEPRHPGNG